MSDLQELRNTIEQRKGKRDLILEEIKELKRDIRQEQRSLKYHEQAREIIREVGIKTQQQLSFHISNITSLALEAVFDNPYALVAEFVQRRNKTECDLFLTRNGNQVDPLSAAGGGVVDIASFALRVALWSMQRPKSRNTLILDEPFKHLSTDLLPKASLMLKEISEKLDLQIIMVTHSDELVEEANKIFNVKIKKGMTQIT